MPEIQTTAARVKVGDRVSIQTPEGLFIAGEVSRVGPSARRMDHILMAFAGHGMQIAGDTKNMIAVPDTHPCTVSRPPFLAQFEALTVGQMFYIERDGVLDRSATWIKITPEKMIPLGSAVIYTAKGQDESQSIVPTQEAHR